MGILRQSDRVRSNTADSINQQIDQEIRDNVALYSNASTELLNRRIDQLDREWDIERAIEVNASALGLVGLILGVTVNRKWLILPGVVSAFLMQHGIQGWCPPVPLFRAFHVRTRKEIEKERYAMKRLRGDEVLEAVDSM